MVTATNPPDRPGDAGYSGTPLHRKLGVKPGSRVLVLDAPDGFDLGVPADFDVEVATIPEEAEPPVRFEVLLLFCPDAARMATVLPHAMARTATGGRCWVAWPKRASKVPTDLTEDVIRDAALAVGWVDVKVAAVDRIWSGLCLMRRTSGSSRSGG
jgi:hypothetical protein